MHFAAKNKEKAAGEARVAGMGAGAVGVFFETRAIDVVIWTGDISPFLLVLRHEGSINLVVHPLARRAKKRD